MCVCVCVCAYIYIYIYINLFLSAIAEINNFLVLLHHHYQDVRTAQIPLTLIHNVSLSAITLGMFFIQHPVLAQSL